MNSIITAKHLSEREQYAGRKWYYRFREIPEFFEESDCKKVATGMAVRYSRITRSWNKERNSEWICRIYLAAKLILAASIQLEARNFAISKNLRIVDPYLAYYAVLSLLRAIVLTLPEQEWADGHIITLSHKKILNIATDHIARFDAGVASTVNGLALRLRASRELISYWHPSSGDRNVQLEVDVERVSTLFSEIAQFNSEILEQSILKRAPVESFDFLPEYIQKLSNIELHGQNFFDGEDAYRLGYLRRKYPAPPNIQHVMTEGHVEDFFGAWASEGDPDGGFDPDSNWRLIFDVP